MPRYQMTFNWGDGHLSFDYFDADKDIEAAAAERATKFVSEYNERRKSVFFKTKTPRTVTVAEYDTVKKGRKRGGHKFKLVKMFVEATYLDGHKRRSEWYEPAIK